MLINSDRYWMRRNAVPRPHPPSVSHSEHCNSSSSPVTRLTQFQSRKLYCLACFFPIAIVKMSHHRHLRYSQRIRCGKRGKVPGGITITLWFIILKMILDTWTEAVRWLRGQRWMHIKFFVFCSRSNMTAIERHLGHLHRPGRMCWEIVYVPPVIHIGINKKSQHNECDIWWDCLRVTAAATGKMQIRRRVQSFSKNLRWNKKSHSSMFGWIMCYMLSLLLLAFMENESLLSYNVFAQIGNDV